MLFLLRSQGIDDISKSWQWFIDVLGLLQLLPHHTSFRNFFWSSQINEIEFWLFCVIFFQIFLVKMNNEKGVASWGSLVHARKRNFPILRPTVHNF